MLLVFGFFLEKRRLYLLEFKIDIMEVLKEKGYNTNRIRKEKLLSQSTLTSIRSGKVPGAKLDTLCELTGLQPGSIIRYIPDDNKTE